MRLTFDFFGCMFGVMNAALIVRRFGGATALARLLGVPKTTVHTWATRDRIPAKHLDRVLRMGATLDPPLRPEDFFHLAQGPL